MDFNTRHFAFYFLLTLLLDVSLTHAQSLVTRDSKITIAPNTSLTVRGTVQNEGIIANNGHMKVSGQWLNSGTYQPGEGEITFNGTSKTVPQIIHHQGQTFNRLNISGGTKKVILSDIVVSRQIHFQNGIMEASGNSRVVFDSGADIIGASDSSHIHGVVFQKGSGHKLFPIGNGSMYLPVELPDVNDASAVVGVQAFEFEHAVLAKSRTLETISNKRYWYIDVASGTLPNSTVVLPLRGEVAFDEEEKVVVVESSSPNEDFTSIGRSVNQADRINGRVKSELRVSKPFVALATTAREAALVVYNAVSNNGDDKNPFVMIENIEQYPINNFTVFNRWGDMIFKVENYDNDQRVFRGTSNINGDSDLVSGTYFYVLEIPGQESLRGFISVKN